MLLPNCRSSSYFHTLSTFKLQDLRKNQTDSPMNIGSCRDKSCLDKYHNAKHHCHDKWHKLNDMSSRLRWRRPNKIHLDN